MARAGSKTPQFAPVNGVEREDPSSGVAAEDQPSGSGQLRR